MKKARSNNMQIDGPLVSIVVPIYKVEPYIYKCVDSLLRQKYSNIEIILVDDDSPDNCPRICDDYASKDTRVKVIHKKNGGLSDARNSGLETAAGEYVAFVDGDDYVSSKYIQSLYDAATQNNADISCCSYLKIYDKRSVRPPKREKLESYTNLEAIRDIFTVNSLCEVMTWNKLYKRSLFIDNKIRFPVGKIHEDNFTTYKIFYHAAKVVFIDEPLYHYVQRSDSIMGRNFNSSRFDIFEMFKEAELFFDSKSVDLTQELQSARLLWTLALYNDYLISQHKPPYLGKRLRAELRNVKALDANPFITKKHKILYNLALASPLMYGQLRIWISKGVKK